MIYIQYFSNYLPFKSNKTFFKMWEVVQGWKMETNVPSTQAKINWQKYQKILQKEKE